MEVGNALTSLLGMTIFGAIGLFYSQNNQDILSRMLYSMLLINGIGSFVYHGTALSWLGSLDGIPMLVLVCIGMNSLYDEIVTEKSRPQTSNRWKSAVSLFSMTYLMIALMAEQYGKGTLAFRIIFAIPMFAFAFTMIYLYVKIRDLVDPIISNAELIVIRKLLIRGWVSGISAFIFWILDLSFCVQSKYVLLFGHWIWHMAIAYFGTCLICTLTFLRGNNYGLKPTITFILGGTIPISYYQPYEIPSTSRTSIVSQPSVTQSSYTSGNTSLSNRPVQYNSTMFMYP
jgi:hypothetical protein